MTPREDGILLRAFVGEADRHGGRPLHRAIVQAARTAGLAGATVLHGPVGFGPAGRVHSERNVDAAENLPLVIEIVDREPAIRAFLPVLDRLIDSGLVTLEKVRMLRCGRGTG